MILKGCRPRSCPPSLEPRDRCSLKAPPLPRPLRRRRPCQQTVRMATPMPEETVNPARAAAPQCRAAEDRLADSSPPRRPHAASPSAPPKRRLRPRCPRSPAPAAARAGVPAGLVIGGGALALMMGLGVAVLLLRSGSADGARASTPPPTTLDASTAPAATTTPPPPPPLAKGVLLVESTPPGAVVTVNGQSRGVTPVEMPGSRGGRVRGAGRPARLRREDPDGRPERRSSPGPSFVPS